MTDFTSTPPAATPYEPWAGLILGHDPATSVTNWSNTSFQSARYFGITQSSTGAQNATRTYSVSLSAGTYTLGLYHQAAADRGIYTVAIDGVTVGTIDGYAASGTTSYGTIAGIVIGQTGKHTVTLTMATKNGTASGYTGDVSAIRLARTA